jgi:hypothetical protein
MRKRFAYLFAFSVIWCTFWLIYSVRVQTEQKLVSGRVDAQFITVSHAVPHKPRPIYRFSVIPGGAYSADELAGARRTDAPVALHYADFRSDRAVLGTLTSDSLMYVSYRKADRIYWTAKKHRIRKGEPVLSDGAHLARARCGNRLSFTPMSPLMPGLQLPDEAFDAPEPPQELTLPKAPPLTPGFDGPDLPFAMALPRAESFPTTEASRAPVTPFGFFPIIAPIGFIGVPGGGPVRSGTGATTGVPVVVSVPAGGVLGTVPEPATLTLIPVGLGCLLIALKRRRSGRSK